MDHPGAIGGAGEAARADTSAPSAAIDWTHAADALCAAVKARAEDWARGVADEVYSTLLYNVQDYLRDNIAFNLGAELQNAKQRELEARDGLFAVAEALGVRTRAWPNSLSVAEVKAAALARIEGDAKASDQ